MVDTITAIVDHNNLEGLDYVEPYAGGAAVALFLLFEGYAARIHINDLSRPIYAFWYSVLHHTEALCRRIDRANVTMEQWHKQREVYEKRRTAKLINLGFSTLFLNRTNRSGIIAGGVIGGQDQSGEWTLGVRFNKDDIVSRIRTIARYRKQIKLYRRDALDFTNEVLPTVGRNALIFYDPPYIENGRQLYLNDYTLAGHRALAKAVTRIKQPWIVTYDRAALDHDIHKQRRRMVYNLKYTAQSRYDGQEVMFFADSLDLPPRSKLLAPKMQLVAAKSSFRFAH